MLAVEFDAEGMASALRGQRGGAPFLQNILDLRSSPRRRCVDRDAEGLRAEILGRLLLLKARADGRGIAFPAADALERLELEAHEKGFWHRRSQPGPLEGHLAPGLHIRDLPRALRREFGRALAAKAPPPAGLAGLRPVIGLSVHARLGARAGLRCAQVVRSTPLEDGATELENNLALLALVAVQQGWQGLAEAVLERCAGAADAGLAGPQVVALARVALTAAGALPSEHALRSFGDVLAALAARTGPQARGALRMELQVLRRVLPPEDWWLGRAAALACGD